MCAIVGSTEVRRQQKHPIRKEEEARDTWLEQHGSVSSSRFRTTLRSNGDCQREQWKYCQVLRAGAAVEGISRDIVRLVPDRSRLTHV